MSTGGTVVLARAKTMSDKMRAYKVMIDDREVGRIRESETQTYDVPAGQHQLKMKIDWTSSPPVTFSLQPGETVRFTCRGPANPFMGIGKMIAMPGRYVDLKRDGAAP